MWIRVWWGFKGIRVVSQVTVYSKKICSYTNLITVYMIPSNIQIVIIKYIGKTCNGIDIVVFHKP